MSALEDLKNLQDAVRKEVPAIKSLMPYINPNQMNPSGKEQCFAAMKAIKVLEGLVKTDSGNIGITIPSGRLGAKGQ